MMDGRYRAENGQVLRNPERTGTGFKVGFVVCTVEEHVTADAAETIAQALNMHLDAYPEQHK